MVMTSYVHGALVYPSSLRTLLALRIPVGVCALSCRYLIKRLQLIFKCFLKVLNKEISLILLHIALKHFLNTVYLSILLPPRRR